MQSLQDIIGNKDFDQPPEIEVIKTFVRKELNSDVKVAIGPSNISITAGSASLAGSLRAKLHKLKKELGTDKKIFIRIAS